MPFVALTTVADSVPVLGTKLNFVELVVAGLLPELATDMAG